MPDLVIKIVGGMFVFFGLLFFLVPNREDGAGWVGACCLALGLAMVLS